MQKHHRSSSFLSTLTARNLSQLRLFRIIEILKNYLKWDLLKDLIFLIFTVFFTIRLYELKKDSLLPLFELILVYQWHIARHWWRNLWFLFLFLASVYCYYCYCLMWMKMMMLMALISFLLTLDLALVPWILPSVRVAHSDSPIRRVLVAFESPPRRRLRCTVQSFHVNWGVFAISLGSFVGAWSWSTSMACVVERRIDRDWRDSRVTSVGSLVFLLLTSRKKDTKN